MYKKSKLKKKNYPSTNVLWSIDTCLQNTTH